MDSCSRQKKTSQTLRDRPKRINPNIRVFPIILLLFFLTIATPLDHPFPFHFRNLIMDFDFNASLYDDKPLVPAFVSVIPSETAKNPTENPINSPETETAPISRINSPESEFAPISMVSGKGVYPVELWYSIFNAVNYSWVV
jgi:hypothetical protein